MAKIPLGEYLQKRECLGGLVVLMDIRHPLKDLDQQMIEWAVSADLPVMLLLTKADKLSQSARSKQVKMVREAILPFQGDIQVEAFSAQNKIGIDKLAAKLDSWFSPLFFVVFLSRKSHFCDQDRKKSTGCMISFCAFFIVRKSNYF